MFSNSTNSLPPTYSQSNNAAAHGRDNRARYDVSPLTRLRFRRVDIAVVDPDSPGIETIRDRGNNVIFGLTPREDQDPDIKNPPGSDGSASLTVALFFLVLFLMWVLMMVILQHGEHISQHGKQDQNTRELIDLLLQMFQEQRLETRDHRD